jgi:hypothetical protein
MTIHDELDEARDLLERLTSCSLVLQGGGHKDATQYEIGVLKREIAFLEKLLARYSNSPPPDGETPNAQ